MQAEKKVKSYTRRTKSGKTVTVRSHTARYEAADKKDSHKKGVGKEIEELMSKKKTPIVGKPEPETEVPFTKEEFKEWYHGTGSAADKKVAKALRKQLGRSGYRKFEDEAIDNHTSRGHLSMFKKLGSMGGDKTSKPVRAKNDTFYPKYTDRGDTKKNLTEEKRQWANHYNETKSESARKGYIQALNRYKGIAGGKLTVNEKAILADEAASKKATSKTKEGTSKNVDAQLKKLGLRMYRTSTGGVEIYKLGDRKSLKNLVAGVHYNGRYISFGGNNEKANKERYEGALSKIFSGGVTEKSKRRPTAKTAITYEKVSRDGKVKPHPRGKTRPNFDKEDDYSW